MGYGTYDVVNSLLTRFFFNDFPVTVSQLQRALEIASVKYKSDTGVNLLQETVFSSLLPGVYSYSLYNKLKSLDGAPVFDYLRGATGEALVVDESQDPYLAVALDFAYSKRLDL